MPNGGTLLISTDEDAAREVLLLTVSDTGNGIDKDVQANVFEPYFSAKETGVGLGLAITKKIIEDHGGRIWLQSALNQGTNIFIELPLASEPELSSARR